MRLYRVFEWDGHAAADDPGGPLFVARRRQGAGRHDAPAKYGAWYCSRDKVAAVAECIQAFRGHTITDDDLARPGGGRKALAELEVDEQLLIVDLDNAAALVKRRLRPSRVATHRRDVTQQIAVSIFEEGAAGIGWWSALNADWPHVTLFHERAIGHVTLSGPLQALSIEQAEVRDAATHLGVRC